MREKWKRRGNERVLNSGIKVSDNDVPPPAKKYKTRDKTGNNSQTGDVEKTGEKGSTYISDKSGGKTYKTDITLYAPPKIGWNRRQKSYRQDENKNMVYIPDKNMVYE